MRAVAYAIAILALLSQAGMSLTEAHAYLASIEKERA